MIFFAGAAGIPRGRGRTSLTFRTGLTAKNNFFGEACVVGCGVFRTYGALRFVAV